MQVQIQPTFIRLWPTTAFDNAVRIMRNQITKIVPVFQLTVSVGTSPMAYIDICMADGSHEFIYLDKITNKPTWTVDQAGLNQAMTDLEA